MSYVQNGPFCIKLSFDPLLKPRLYGVQRDLACTTCLEWYQPKVYFLVPKRASKIDDLLEIVKAEHGIQSEISFIAGHYSVSRSFPVESLRGIQEPIDVVPIGPGAPEVDFPKCNCAAAANSNQIGDMIRNLNEAMGENDDKSNMTEVRPHSVLRSTYTIQHPGNIVPPTGETSKVDDELQNSSASSRPVDVTAASEMMELTGSQEHDQSDDNGTMTPIVASASEMALSVQESISTKAHYGSGEAGESTGCEDMGSAVDVSCKETEDDNQQCYPAGVNATASNHGQCDSDEQSGYSSDLTTMSSSLSISYPRETVTESQEGDDEMDMNEVDGEEDSSVEISVEATRKNDSAKIVEGASESEGVTAENTSEDTTNSESITSGCDLLNECLHTPQTSAEKVVESEEDFDEHGCFFASTPKSHVDTVRTSKGTPYAPLKFFDTTIAHGPDDDDDDDDDDDGVDDDDYDDQEEDEEDDEMAP